MSGLRPTIREMQMMKKGLNPGKFARYGTGYNIPLGYDMNQQFGFKKKGKGAIATAGGAYNMVQMYGEGANFKKLSKAEQKKVLSVIKRIMKHKKSGGSMLTDQLKSAIMPQSSLGRALLKRVSKGLLAPSFWKMVKGFITGSGSLKLAGQGPKRPVYRERKACRAKMNNTGGAIALCGGGRKKTSKWILHVKAVAKKKGISYKEAMKVAKKSYRK